MAWRGAWCGHWPSHSHTSLPAQTFYFIQFKHACIACAMICRSRSSLQLPVAGRSPHQHSRKHKNVMNVMWRSCGSLGSLVTGHRWHWPGQNPETRCDMLIHTRESIFIHVKTELVTIRNILVRLLE